MCLWGEIHIYSACSGFQTKHQLVEIALKIHLFFGNNTYNMKYIKCFDLLGLIRTCYNDAK